MNVWRLIAHHARRERAVSWAKQNGRIAIGWGCTGDLSAQELGSYKDIAASIKRAYEEGRHPVHNFSAGGHSLWDFQHVVQPGDLVILAGSQTRELVARVEGEYEWREETPTPDDGYNHQRRVQITQLDPEAVWQAAGAAYVPGVSVYRTLVRLANDIDDADLQAAST